MTFEKFRQSIDSQEMPDAGLSPALQALWWARKGSWDKAHRVCQEDSGADGSWVHAHLHREEGDLGNARYWYAKANREPAENSLQEEWEAMTCELLQR